MDQSTINPNTYEIKIEIVGIVPYVSTPEISSEVVRKMMELGRYKTASAIAPKMDLSGGTVSKILKEKARLDIRKVDFFLKKHPKITAAQIFNGHTVKPGVLILNLPPEPVELIGNPEPPSQSMPVVDQTQKLAKDAGKPQAPSLSITFKTSKRPPASKTDQDSKRTRFLIGLQGLLKYWDGYVFNNAFPPEEQEAFKRTGFLKGKWIKEIVSTPKHEPFLSRYLPAEVSIDQVKELSFIIISN